MRGTRAAERVDAMRGGYPPLLPLPDAPLLPDEPPLADELLPEPDAAPIELDGLLLDEPAVDRLLAVPADAVLVPEPERVVVALDEMPSAAIVDESS